MRRKLSTEEIAAIGLADDKSEHLESLFETGEGDYGFRRYDVAVRDVTNTFCAPYISVDLTQTGPNSCVIQWSVFLPNGYGQLVESERGFAGSIQDLATRQFAIQKAVEIAQAWGPLFRAIVLPTELTDLVAAVASAAAEVTAQLETVGQHASVLPADGRAALNQTAYGAGVLSNRVATLAGFVAGLQPVQH